MKDNFSEVEQRVRRYWFVDGLVELVGGGGMCLLLAVYFAVGQYFGEDSPVSGLLQASLVLVLIGGIFLARRLIDAMKARVTYPRTGYVEYQSNEKNRAWRGALSVLVGIVMAVTLVFIARQFNRIDALVAGSGVVTGIVLFVKQIWTARVRRFYILSLASLLYGMVLSVSGLPRGYNLGLFYVLLSISFAISGGLTLKKYLDENPLRAEPENGR